MAQTDVEDYSDTCGTIADCISRLENPADPSLAPALVGARLSVHGPAGADALMPLLADSSAEVRRLAAVALDQFETLDPRHLPALIAAHRQRLDVADPIARTGSDQALRYLEAAWAVDDEADSARWALPLFGTRAHPFLLRQLERCRQTCSRREADALLYAFDRIGPLPDAARAVILEVAASETADPELRREMEDQLIFRWDPTALPILNRRLLALRGNAYEDWQAASLIERIGGYGQSARASAGPIILSYLSRSDLRHARIAAVVATWAIEYRPAVPVLRALLAEADGDWHLAYDALFALAELGGDEARPEIERLARSHWYAPVRNNARRALNRLNGGAFELPEQAGEQRGPYAGGLNFYVDVDPVRDCRFDAADSVRHFGRTAPVPLGGSRRGTVRVAFDPLPAAPLTALGEAPDLAPAGRVTLDWNRGGERIVGIDAEQWDGGLYVAEANRRPRRILTGNVLGAFEATNGIYVVTGDSFRHVEGDLWQLRTGDTIVAARAPLRLPASPTGYALTGDGTLLIRTERGDVAVASDGRLLAPHACRDTTALQ